MSTSTRLLHYINTSPTSFHAVASSVQELKAAGFTPLLESACWQIKPGGKYYVTRNSSSLIAFRIPEEPFSGFMITASHSDSPCFKIKETPELKDSAYVRLSTERYGGMLMAPWFDRPLTIAGRITLKTDTGIKARLVHLPDPCAVIPNVAIHMNRKANDGFSYNPAVDLLPLWSQDSECESVRARVSRSLNIEEEDILSTDLYLVCAERGFLWDKFITSPRLDDLQCAYASLAAFLNARPSKSAGVYCLFDNEEVGSETKQGAASTFLSDTLGRIADSLNFDLREKLPCSFLASCDNAHAIHPNHPEYADKNHTVEMNQGVVIKHNANQKYTTDAISSAIFKTIAARAGVPLQEYCNRADMAGGSTLGNISNTQVSLNSIDIGCAQLAMHSCVETAGTRDTDYLIQALISLYESSLEMTQDGQFTIH